MASVAILGAGYWGKNLIRNLHALGALKAVVKKHPSGKEKVQEWAPGVPLYTDAGKVWADPAIQGVVIATPAETHYALARRALEAGKDVFVEKPLALDLAEGRELVRRAAEAGRVLMVGHLFEYHPALTKLYELLQSGALGELRYLVSRRLNWGRFRSEENALWSLAPHDLGILARLAGAVPERVIATGGCYLQPKIADLSVVQLDWAGGVRGHVFVSWLHPLKERCLTVIGSGKMAVFDDMAKTLTLYDHGVEWREGRPLPVPGQGMEVDFPAAEPLRMECRDFLDCIASRKKPVADGAFGLDVLRVLDAAQRSMEANGQAMSVADGA